MTLFSIFAKPYPIHSKPYMIHRDKSIDVPIVVYLGRFDPPHPDPGRLDHHDRRSLRHAGPERSRELTLRYVAGFRP